MACAGNDCPAAESPSAGPAGGDSGAPTIEELRSATYAGIDGTRGPISLSEGRWRGAPYVTGGSSAPSVMLVGDLRLTGDIDGDGSSEAIVLLAASSGGSGERLYIAVVGRREGRPRSLATARIGDRVQVRGLRIESRRILVDVVQAGPHDAMCCPGDLVTRSWQLESGSLKESSPRRTGRLTPEVLADAEWVLRELDSGVRVPDAPRVTLRFQRRLRLSGGRVTGSAGCNRYDASMTSSGSPGAVSMSPASTTRMACADSVMPVETRFLQQLAGVHHIRFFAGRLGLAYTRERREGIMYFERRSPADRNRSSNPE
jgi:heat shock protein HslJ